MIIPQAVYDETTGLGFPGTQYVLQAVTSGWLQVRPVATIASTIPVELDDGEREAIAKRDRYWSTTNFVRVSEKPDK